MTPTLTEEQRQAVAEHPGEPVRCIDPMTNRAYVLLPADIYERVKELLSDNPRDAYPAIDRAFAEGWEAPGMDDYDRYEEIKR